VKSLVAYFDSIGKVAGGLTALVALISAAVALYFVLRPPPPVKGKAEFTRQGLRQFGPPIPFESYLDLAGESRLIPRYPPRVLSATGVYYAVPLSLVGLRNVDTKLVWSLYRSTDRAPIADWINQQAGTLDAPRNDFACVVKVWIQLPPTPGRYFAVIDVDLGSNTLDTLETPTFRGLITQGPPPTTTPATTTTGPVITSTAPTRTITTPTITVVTTTGDTTTTSTTVTRPTTTTSPPPSRTVVRPPAIIAVTRTSPP
jgi:hypothetical protein